MNLDEVLALYRGLPEGQKAAIAKDALDATTKLRWVPNPGPQTEAYFSKADCLLYGGQPGGGKSQLLLGLAFNCHERTLVMRRQYSDLERIIDDALKIHGSRDGFNGSPPPRLRINDKQVINFRAAQYAGDEQSTMGQGRDLLAIDEATHFTEDQIRFLMGWVRTETPGQRCRTVLATNPPLSADGYWVNSMFAPWLDPKYPWPAKEGELRWVISNEEGKDEWVEGPDDVRVVHGKSLRPSSRSYISAAVKDNPYYAATDYERQLDGMGEPHRSALMGGFQFSFKDADRQLIPTAWITAAMDRWKPDGYKGLTMTAAGLDMGAGCDETVLACRYGGWYAPLQTMTGDLARDPAHAAGMVVKNRRDNCPIVVDVGGGFGGASIVLFRENGIAHQSYNGAGGSTAKTKDGKLSFVNKRAEAWWRFREELDPGQQGGSAIALPPDPQLRADLASPTWDLKTRGIQIEAKEDIKKRIGRSPDRGDAVVMALSEGNKAAVAAQNRRSGFMPKVVMGGANIRRPR